ncbi:DUF3618 domain-containing protein [Rhodosalinus sp.]|uniref:DUF3618 domain-containing protein n=1 Tax=Rhodosalinus sp. TaxID=2047741 RepID=UPI00397B1074
MAQSETPEAIERDIAERRDALARTLQEVQGRVAPGALAEEAGAALRGSGAELAGKAGRVAARNPLAIALILGGIAWLALNESGAAPSGGSARKAVDRAKRGVSDHPVAAGGAAAVAAGASIAAAPPVRRRLRRAAGSGSPAALHRHAEAEAARAEAILVYECARAAHEAELDRAAREAGTASHAPPPAPGPGSGR